MTVKCNLCRNLHRTRHQEYRQALPDRECHDAELRYLNPTCESVGDMSAGSPSLYQEAKRRQLTRGRNMLMTCKQH